MTSSATPTCNVDRVVARAVFDVSYVQGAASGDRHRFHGNITDLNVVIVESSLNEQSWQAE